MKRILSVILAAALVLSLVPAVFAEGGDVVYNPEYVFTKAAYNITEGTGIALDTVGNDFNREVSTGMWGYVNKHNIKTANVQSTEIAFYTPGYGTEESPITDNALVLWMDVDETGYYVPTIEYPKNQNYYAKTDWYMIHEDVATENEWDITGTGFAKYISKVKETASMTDSDADVLHIASYDAHKETAVNESFAPALELSAGRYYLVGMVSCGAVVSKHGSARSYGTLAKISLDCKGTVSVTADKTEIKLGNNANVLATVTDGNGNVIPDAVITYTSSNADIATVDAATGVVTTLLDGKVDIIATAMVDGIAISGKVELTIKGAFNPTFVFKTSAFKNVADITDAKNGIRLFLATNYDYINTDVSAGRWGVVNYFNMTNNLVSAVDSLICVDDVDFNRNVTILKTEFDAAGIYQPTINVSKKTYAGKLNLWAIPASEVNGDFVSYIDAYNVIEKAQYIGSVDTHSDSTDPTTFVGNDVYMAAGDNYIFMTVTKGVGETENTNGYYYAYFSDMSFVHKAGIYATINDKQLALGQSEAISTKILDAKGNKIDAEITYASSNNSVATVSTAGVVTAVGDGNATITVTAKTADATYIKTIDISASIIYDPSYVFKANAILGATGSPNMNTVTDEEMLDKSISSGVWTFSSSSNFKTHSLYGAGIQARGQETGTGNNAIVLNAKVDTVGTYKTSIEYNPGNVNGVTYVYIVPKAYAASKGWDMATLDGVNAAKVDSELAGSKVAFAGAVDMHSDSANISPYTGNVINVAENDFYILISVKKSEYPSANSSGAYFSQIAALSLEKTASVKLLADKTTLSKGDTTKLIATVKDNRDNAAEAEVTYESLNTAIATVDGDIVTAVAKGKAIIRATATVDGATVSDTVEIVVGDEAVAKTVTIATSINGEVDILPPWTRGSEAKVIAPEIGGKTFRHWVLGTEESGIPVSDKAEYTFKAVSNTYLTAVYSENAPADAKVVEFYVDNGGYIGNAIANEEGKVTLPAVKPSLTGFEFSKWMLDAKTVFTEDTIVEDLLTKVVATYNASKINNTEYYYGDKIVNTSENAKVWKRDDKIVAYGTEYTYYVWADSVITSEDGERPKAPIIVLDSNEKQDGAKMIEYDANGFTIVEAGILFGDGKAMTVDSCKYKAKSNRNSAHGQFTAKPFEESYIHARGYLIYKDGDDYKVVYSH